MIIQGSLTTGLGNRYVLSRYRASVLLLIPISFSFVLASTQELHEKIAQLATRVRQLEDSLRVSHSQLSTDQHPLLTEELLKIKAPLQRDTSQQKSPTTPVKEEENNDEVSASGSLVIGESGKTKYYGQTASSWVCMSSPTSSESCLLTFVHSVIPRSTSDVYFWRWIYSQFDRTSWRRRTNPITVY